MKKFLFITMALAASALLADKFPKGFSVRGCLERDMPDMGDMTVRLYKDKAAALSDAVWSNSVPYEADSDRMFTIMVTDGGDGLQQLFKTGEVRYIGLEVPDCRELPRRAISTVPMVDRALTTKGLAKRAKIGNFVSTNATLRAESLAVSGMLTAAELKSDESSKLSIGMDLVSVVGGCGLKVLDHADNSILAPKVLERKAEIRPGVCLCAPGDSPNEHLLVNDHGGVLMISSDDGVSVPAVTVPVGAGEEFTWPQGGYEGSVTVRLFVFGN